MSADSGDGQSPEELAERIDELEAQMAEQQTLIQRMMPSRREVVAGAGGSILAALGLGATMGGASAADTSSGTLGASGDSQDIVLDEIKDPGGDVVADLDDTGDLAFQNSRGVSGLGSLDTEKIDTDAGGNGYTWQDVTSSRSFDSWFTAPSDRDIWFAANAQSNSADTLIRLLPNVNTSQSQFRLFITGSVTGNSSRFGISPIRVPAGQEYQLETGGDTADFSLENWTELR